MSPRHSTFGKLQRERDKRAKAVAKQERRAAIQAEAGDSTADPAVLDAEDEQRLLSELADLHRSYEAGLIGLDDFEVRREQLRARLQVG